MLNTPSRAELIAAELERRARKRAARSSAAAVDPMMERWAGLGVQATDTVIAIRQSLTGLLQDSSATQRDYHEVISRAVKEIPDTTLPSALKTALADLDPILLIAHLHRLIEAGIPWMSELGIKRTALLAAPRPQFGSVRPLTPALLDGDIYWRLYLAVLGHPARLAPEETMAIMPGLPLPIVDDLIDMGVIGREDKPWVHREDKYESVYVRARLAPASITRAEAEHIAWTENVARHDFLNGEAVTGDDMLERLTALYRGSTDDIFGLRAMLPPTQRALVDEVLEGARIGRWPAHITADRGLWGLLLAQWTASIRQEDQQRGVRTARGARLINAAHSEFHAWRAFCAAYEWILTGQIDRAVEQAKSLEKVSRISPSLHAEINNLLAYLAHRPDEWRHEDLEQAENFLAEVRGLHPAVEANLTLVRERRMISVNNRSPWENPYFTLGLPHGDPGWNERWQELSFDYRDDIERSAALNEAWTRLNDIERFGTLCFALPLDPNIIELPQQRSAALIPPLQPLSRRTTTGKEELQFIKCLAAPHLLTDFTP